MFVDFLFERFEQGKELDAIVWRDKVFSYGHLLSRVRYFDEILVDKGIVRGSVVALEADFSPDAIALFLSLTERGCILVPLTKSLEMKKGDFRGLAQCEVVISVGKNDSVRFSRLPTKADHALYSKLRSLGHPGLVVFSSGTMGENKAILHDLVCLLEKFKTPRYRMRAITFLLFDHLGAINTMLYQLSNTGCIVTVRDRTPETVLGAVAKHKVELLPTSPTFINLVLLSEAYKRYDLSSLRTVTYGTEPMQESTLRRFHELFPNIRLQQTYGLSEVGVLRSKSKSSDSLWVKVGGEEFQTRVVNGILQIKAQSAMLGYLNAPSPFTEDGWFDTGDLVEVDGDYVKILGRKSEIINIGGQKVCPSEVESVVQECDNVKEVCVYGERNALVGNIICADVSLKEKADQRDFITRLKKHCRSRLPLFKVPVKVNIVNGELHSERFKKKRRIEYSANADGS